MEGVQPLEENVSRPRFKWKKKLLLLASVIQGLTLLLCLVSIGLNLYPSPVKYPSVQSIKVQLTRCEQDRLFFIPTKNEYQTMQVENNSIIITCDSLYLIYLKASFFQEVGISLHFRDGQYSVPIPTMDRGQRVDHTMVTSFGFKDIIYLNVKASNTSCRDLQINGGELILTQLNPSRYCAP